MKRFLAFAYDLYYPGGGKCDFCGDFAALEEAVLRAARHANGRLMSDCLDVLDTTTGEWKEFMAGKDNASWRAYETPPVTSSPSLTITDEDGNPATVKAGDLIKCVVAE